MKQKVYYGNYLNEHGLSKIHQAIPRNAQSVLKCLVFLHYIRYDYRHTLYEQKDVGT